MYNYVSDSFVFKQQYTKARCINRLAIHNYDIKIIIIHMMYKVYFGLMFFSLSLKHLLMQSVMASTTTLSLGMLTLANISTRMVGVKPAVGQGPSVLST